jgi:hypothetical protein
MKYLSIFYILGTIASLSCLHYSNSIPETISWSAATIGHMLGAITNHPNWK